jgi:hypothetical protein
MSLFVWVIAAVVSIYTFLFAKMLWSNEKKKGAAIAVFFIASINLVLPYLIKLK